MGDNKIRAFTDLKAWQEGHKLVLMIYEITDKFPSKEQFSLVSQMRRAVVSVTSNIAEGFSRQSFRDKVHFYSMSHGSLTELQNQLIIAKDIRYINASDFEKISAQSVFAHKLLSGLIKSSKARIRDS